MFGRLQFEYSCMYEDVNLKLNSPHLNDAAKRVASLELIVHKRNAKKNYNILLEEAISKNEPCDLSLFKDFV